MYAVHLAHLKLHMPPEERVSYANRLVDLFT